MSLQNSHQISDVKVMLKQGKDGNGIESIEKTGTSGNVDTYTITFTDGTKTTYTVTNGESGGIYPHIIVISESGSTVTLTKGSTVITASETSTGHFEADVTEFGTWVIDAILGGDDAQVSLVVDTVKVYTVDDSHFHATLTVKYPSGATCRLQSADETLYATGSPYTFTVHHAETYTITVTYNQRIYTDTVTFTTEGQSFSKTLPTPSEVDANDINWWLFFGGVTETYASLSEILANSTALATLMASTDAVDYLVRCKDWIENKGLVPVMTSDTTPSGTVISSGEITNNEAYHVFDGIAPQTSSGDIWVPTTTGQATWVGYDFGTPIQVNKVMINNTLWYGTYRAKDVIVEASNDLSTWTPISETLTLAQNSNDQIFTFDNNVSYRYWRFHIVSSYDATNNWFIRKGQFYKFADSIPENANAMTYIGLNNYASNTLLADADWLDGIANSTYFESVLTTHIPTMTSDTTPSGVCYGTNPESNSEAYKAFDNDDTTAYSAYNGTTTTLVGEWLSYEFTNLVQLVKVAILFFGKTNTSSYRYPKVYSIQGYDGSKWVTLYTRTTTTTSDSRISFEDIISPSSKYIKFRLLAEERHTSGDIELEIFTMQFYGREDV